MFKEYPVMFFLANLLPGETLCKFFQIFPPIDLVYTEKKFVHTFQLIKSIYKIENKGHNEIETTVCLSVTFIVEIIKFFSYSNYSGIINSLLKYKYKIGYEKLKKKRRMRILSARIFLSLLAGKLDKIEQPLP